MAHLRLARSSSGYAHRGRSREVAFDAALLQPGRNVLTLTVPAGPVNNGVIYDYLRLELDETATVAGRSQQ